MTLEYIPVQTYLILSFHDCMIEEKEEKEEKEKKGGSACYLKKMLMLNKLPAHSRDFSRELAGKVKKIRTYIRNLLASRVF